MFITDIKWISLQIQNSFDVTVRTDWVCNVRLSLGYVPVYFGLFLCLFVFIWVWITRTQKLQKHTLAQIHKASQIRSDHLGQNF